MTAAGTPADQGKHGRAIWVLIMTISLGVSLGLNIWHAVDPPESTSGNAASPVDGRVFLALIVGILPVIMNALMLHVFPKKHVPAAVKWIVAALFAVALYMSMSAVYALLDPVTGDHVRTVGMVAIIDVPALLGLYMLARKPPAESARPVAQVGEAVPRAVGPRPVAEPIARPVAPAVEAVAAPVARPVAEATGDRLPTAPAPVERPVARPVAAPVADDPRPVGDRSPEPTADRSPEPTAEPPRKAVPTGGLSTRDRARLALAANPALNGAELARELGISPERGRTLLRELKRERAAQDAGQEAEVIHLPAAVNE